MEKIKWGILGTSKICNAIIPCIKKLNYDLVGVATRNLNNRNAFFKNFKIKKKFIGYKELLKDNDINYIYIPLPNTLHLKWCLEAVKKNKNVLCEKPLCLKSKDVKKIIKATKGKNIIVAEAIMYRHNLLIKKLKKILNKNNFGKIIKIKSNFFRDYNLNQKNIRFEKELGGGSLYDLGYYSISLINFLFNSKPKKFIGKRIIKKGVDVKFYGKILYTGNKIGEFCSSFIDKKNDQTVIYCEKAKISIPCTFFRGEKKIIIESKNSKKILYANERVHRYQKQIENIVLSSKKIVKREVDLDETLKNVYCMEMVEKSSQKGKIILV